MLLLVLLYVCWCLRSVVVVGDNVFVGCCCWCCCMCVGAYGVLLLLVGWCLSSVVVLGGSVPSDEFKKPPLPVLAQPPSVSEALNFIRISVMMHVFYCIYKYDRLWVPQYQHNLLSFWPYSKYKIVLITTGMINRVCTICMCACPSICPSVHTLFPVQVPRKTRAFKLSSVTQTLDRASMDAMALRALERILLSESE